MRVIWVLMISFVHRIRALNSINSYATLDWFSDVRKTENKTHLENSCFVFQTLKAVSNQLFVKKSSENSYCARNYKILVFTMMQEKIKFKSTEEGVTQTDTNLYKDLPLNGITTKFGISIVNQIGRIWVSVIAAKALRN